MAGLTAEGLVIKRYADILEEKRNRAVSRFLDLVEPWDQVDTGDSTTLGRLIALSIPGEADLWEAVQEVYSAFDPNAATGVALDNLVALGGIERFGETRSTAQAIFTGDTGTLITQGSTVRATTTSTNWSVIGGGVGLEPSRASGIQVQVTSVQNEEVYSVGFSTDSSSTNASYTSSANATEQEILSGLLLSIQNQAPTLRADISDGRLVVDNRTMFQEGSWSTSDNISIAKVSKVGTVMAENPGPIEQAPNTITSISTPILGWDRVYNPGSAVPGRFVETDEELRVRFRNSKYQRAGNILEALYTALIGIPDVQEVKVYENDTDVTDENGVPPHSFMPVVLGGDSTIIAQEIWDNKPLGIRSYGNTVVTIIDSQFFPHDIGFERPAPVPVYITINLTVDTEFPSDGVAQIKQALVDYFSTFRIGDDVIYSRLYTPINKVPGHQIDAIYLGATLPPTSSDNIVVPFNMIASIDPNNITINT